MSGLRWDGVYASAHGCLLAPVYGLVDERCESAQAYEWVGA